MIILYSFCLELGEVAQHSQEESGYHQEIVWNEYQDVVYTVYVVVYYLW